MSEESELIKELEVRLEAISKEIEKATIAIKEPPKSNKRMRCKPFISLEIPNKLFPLWNKQRNLREKVKTEEPSLDLIKLVNKNIIGNLISIKAGSPADERLRKLFSAFNGKYKKMGGVQRNKTLSKDTSMLLYEDEISSSPPTAPVTKVDKKETPRQASSKPFSVLSKRQQRRRKATVKSSIMNCLNSCRAANGLNLVSVMLKTENNQKMNLEYSSEEKENLDVDRVFDRNTESVLYLLMKHGVSIEFYHELSMLFKEELPRTYQVKECKRGLYTPPILKTPGCFDGVRYNFIELLSDKLDEKISLRPDLFKNNEVDIKISCDGAKYTRLSNYCLLSFTILTGEKDLSSTNIHTISVIKAKENYENISTGFQCSFTEINALLRSPHITVAGKMLQLNFYLCCDYKLILLMLGLKEANSNNACAWCTVHKNHRWDMDVEDNVYLVKQKRTLQMLKGKTSQDSQHEPLLDIELDHVVPDELHLLLRITDVLINNIITSAIRYDINNSSGKPKPLEGPMVKLLLNEIRKHVGDQFTVYEKDKYGWKFSSLSGDDRQKLLKSLPPSFHTCQPPEICNKVQNIWEDFNKLYTLVSAEKPKKSYYDIHQQAKEWVRLFLKPDCEGYWAANVTPYMHILVYHVPHFIRQYGNIKKFSCQGVEHNNNTTKRTFFQKSNKWDGCADILATEYKLDTLKYCERVKNKHTKRKQNYWYGKGILENRSKRARIGRYYTSDQQQRTTKSLGIIKKYKMQSMRKMQTKKLAIEDTTCSAPTADLSTCSQTDDQSHSQQATVNAVGLLNRLDSYPAPSRDVSVAISEATAEAHMSSSHSIISKVTAHQGLAASKYNKPLGATFPDDPIQQDNNCITAELFLKHQGRKMESVLGDGNCLFRALSFRLFEDEELHSKIRSDITHMINENKQKFTPLLIQETSIEAHIRKMYKLGTWGTHLEIIAAATLYQLPIYVASRRVQGQAYYWRKYSPISVDNLVSINTGRTHIELIHINDCHFDPVIPISSYGVSEPVIPCREYLGGVID